MHSTQVAQRVQEVAAPILWAMGLELVEVVCVGQGPRMVVRLFLDKPGGVTLEDCERAHSALSPALDVADPIPHAYTLEVSSPGLDRPLKTPKDFQRAMGKLLNVKLSQPLEQQWRVIGRLLSSDDEGIVLMVQDGKHERMVRLARGMIAVAKLEIEF